MGIKVGDIVNYQPFVLHYEKDMVLKATGKPCRVVWIHPRGIYAVVQRDTDLYSYRETIWLENQQDRRGTSNENNRNYEPKGRGGEDRHVPHFGRRAAPRREDFGAR